jgi:hypothetical protein
VNADPDALRRAADEMDALINRQAAHLADIERLTFERDDLARRLEAAELDRAGLVATTDTLRRGRDEARDALAKLRQKANVTEPTTPKWSGDHLPRGAEPWYWVYLAVAGWWAVSADYKVIGRGVNEPSARRLAELLAGFDPGGIWCVAGEPVTVAVVRAVCPSVAVSWGPA